MVSQSEFNAKRQALKDFNPLQKRVKLSDIKLDDHSIRTGLIEIDGSKVPVSGKFFGRLGQMVNLNAGLIQKMAKNEDREPMTKLIQAVKGYQESRDGGKEFILIGDPAKHQLVNISKADKWTRITNDTLFSTAETILNHVPNLQVESIDHQENGDLSINIIHGHQQEFLGLGADEVFRFGFSLVSGQMSSRVNDFFLRLSCENGAVAKNLHTAFEFGQGDQGFRELLSSMIGWEKTGFVPRHFMERVTRAQATRASYFELERAVSSVTGAIKEQDPDLKSRLMTAAETNFFPEFDAATKRIYRAGRNPLQLTDGQKKFIKTDKTVWDTINELTWIGSHQTEYGLKNWKGFKKQGGDLFTKTWDLEHADLSSI
jgi:hypothetical protein